jgi:hypothetical protein
MVSFAYNFDTHHKVVLLADHLMEGEFQSCTNFGVFAIQKAIQHQSKTT